MTFPVFLQASLGAIRPACHEDRTREAISMRLCELPIRVERKKSFAARCLIGKSFRYG